MGLIIGKIEERRRQDKLAYERQQQFLESASCPEYFSSAHKVSMGMRAPDEEEEEEEEEEEINLLEEEDSDEDGEEEDAGRRRRDNECTTVTL